MVDRQSNAPDSSAPEPLSLKAFAASLYHAERADNYFKFLKNFSEEDLASFVQGLLRQVGDAIDDGSTEALARFVEQGQVAAYAPTQTPAPFRPDFPDSPSSDARCAQGDRALSLPAHHPGGDTRRAPARWACGLRHTRGAEGHQRHLSLDAPSRTGPGGSDRCPGGAQLLLSRADQHSAPDAGERAAVGADAQR